MADVKDTKLKLFLILSLLLAGCNQGLVDGSGQRGSSSGDSAARTAPAQSADQFIARVNKDLEDMGREVAAANWLHATYINDDSALLAARAGERFLAYQSRIIKEARQYDGTSMSADSARAIKLLKLMTSMPAPDDPAKRAELTQISTRLEGEYGTGKYCPGGPGSCRTLNELVQVMADKKHDYAAQLDAWKGWRTVSPKMRADYQRMVELENEGARELGYANVGEMWRDGYDMSPADFEQETERLWAQVKPLYKQLHCYARSRLADFYGEDRVSRSGLIPAHLLGNMWAQQWNEIYDLLEPYPGVSDLDLDTGLKAMEAADVHTLTGQGMKHDAAERQAQKAVALKMVHMAQDFYTSMGLPELPPGFWDRSLFLKPRDREVVCHASAWDMDGNGDVRLKQCIEPTGEMLFTVFHELGHLYYDLEYRQQPPLFQGAAQDGFHEAIGDTINLSMTPQYMQRLGLVKQVRQGREATINAQMKLALDKIAFLPFGKMIDQWRWAVFDGRIKPSQYNAAWWDLRRKYQGIAAPVPRSEQDFDPGAKYHIPANVPYTRYFLSFILQFQFHKALCDAAGWRGPLYECSVYGSREAGKRFAAMLALGQSRPWQDALQQLTGTREMDAAPLKEYFQPLLAWLEQENRGKTCGWE